MTNALENSFSVELEQEVLGAVLLSSSVKNISGHLRPEHFIEPLHQRIFGAALEAQQSYGMVSPGMICKAVPAGEQDTIKSKLSISLPEYLARLISNCARGPARLRDTAQAVVAQWARINVGREAGAVHEAASNPAVNAADLTRTSLRVLETIAASLRTGGKGRSHYSLGEAAALAIDDVARAMASGTGLTGISWGLADMDRMTGGLQRGEMVVLGARPSMGKTAVGGSVALSIARSGVPVGMISLEMGAKALSMRSLSDMAFDLAGRIPYTDLLTGRVAEADFEKIVVLSEEFKRLPYQIEEASGLTVEGIRAKLDRMNDIAEQSGEPIGVLVVDYLQLVAASSRYQGNRVAEVAEISAGLRAIARDYNLALVALSQLSRGVESRPLKDRRPTLSDLRESGAIEQDADMVCFLLREAYYLAKEKGSSADEAADLMERFEACKNKLELIIAKQRMGPVGTVDLFFDPACSAVRNAAKEFGNGPHQNN